jgi:hypothetical protein
MNRFAAALTQSLLLVLLVLIARGAAQSGGVDDLPPPPDPDVPPPQVGMVSGQGTLFAVTGVDTLDVTVVSQVPVSLEITSLPSTLTLLVSPVDEADSTRLTISGLRPQTPYYLYVDRLQDGVERLSDADGVLVVEQALDGPHLITLARRPSTFHIPADTQIGTWDPVSRVFTLTTDVDETIEITEDDITLDGAGHALTGDGSYGIYAVSRRDVTIRDVHLIGTYSYGIYVQNVTRADIGDLIIEDNVVESTAGLTDNGIWFHDAHGGGEQVGRLVVRGNRVVARQYGIHVRQWDCAVEELHIEDNQVRIDGAGGTFGVYNNALRADVAGDVVVAGNDVEHTLPGTGSHDYGIYIDHYHGQVAGAYRIADNRVTSPLPPATPTLPYYGIHAQLRGAPSTYGAVEVARNDVRNRRYGLYLFTPGLTTTADLLVVDNVVAGAFYWASYLRFLPADAVVGGNDIEGRYGLTVVDTESAHIEDNDIAADLHDLTLQSSSDNQIAGNRLRATGSAHGGARGVRLVGADGNVFRLNKFTGFGVGMELSNAHDNVIYQNDFVDPVTPVLLAGGTNNRFSLPLPQGGNHWPAGVGTDQDGDGIADMPFDLGGGIVDVHPWTTDTGWQVPWTQAGSDVEVTCLADAAWVTLDGSGSVHPAGASLTYTWQSDTGLQAAGATPTLLLPAGTHRFALTASAAEYSAVDTVVVHVLADTEAPVVAITSLADSAWVRGTAADIAGTITEAVGLDDVLVGGRGARLAGTLPAREFSRRVSLEAEGANEIDVTATDRAGHTGQARITLFRDTEAPSAQIVAPAAGAWLIDDSELVVEVDAADAGSGVVEVTANGTPLTFDGSRWGGSIDLGGQGERRLVVRVTDAVGHRTTTERDLLRDTKAPSLSLASPTNRATVPPAFAVTGAARDNGSGLASVTIDGAAASIDGDTFHADIELPAGEHRLTVTATDSAGHQTSREVTVQVAAPAADAVVLRLTDSQAQPLAGVRVDLRRANGGGTGLRGDTDSNGTVAFDADPQTPWLLRVSHGGERVDYASASDTLHLSLQSRALVLRGSGGAPVEGARVRLLTSNGGAGNERTDAAGRVSWDVLPGQSHAFEVFFAGDRQEFAADAPEVTVDAQPTHLRLIDADGAPMTDVTVRLLSADSTGAGERADTDAAGVARFDVLPGTQHAFRVSHLGHDWISPLTADSVAVTAARSRFVLRTAAGVGIEGARVRLLREDGRGATHATTGTDGAVAFDVLPGMAHGFEVTHQRQTWQQAAVTAGDSLILLAEEAALALTAHDGAPLPDVRVDLVDAEGRHAGARVNTDADGVARFDVLPGAQHAFRVSHLRSDWTSDAFTGGAAVDLQTQLSQLRLTDADGIPVTGARVDLITWDGERAGSRAQTGADGSAGFETLPGCNARFRVTHHGATTETEMMPCGDIATLSMASVVQSLTLTLVDPAGSPIAGARVRLLKENGGGTGERADTDSTGTARFTVLPGSQQPVEVTYHGHREIVSDFTGGEATLQTQERQLVVTANGLPLDNVRVRLLKENGGGAGVSTRTDSDGVARVDVLPSMPHLLEVRVGGQWHTTGLLVGGGLTALEVPTAAAKRLVAGATAPARTSLLANYPNPFNPSTTIPFALEASADVRLTVYDMLGQRVAELADAHLPAGAHQVTWDARDAGGRPVAAGVYLVRLVAGAQVDQRRVTLIK